MLMIGERKKKIAPISGEAAVILPRLVSAAVGSKKGTGSVPVPFKNCRAVLALCSSPPHVVPLGISLGAVSPFVMAWKIPVNFVMLWLAVAVARQPLASSE